MPEGRKRVRYWACEATGGQFAANREVDELWWAPLAEAQARLDPTHDAPGARAVRGRHPADPPARGRAARVGRDKRAWTGDDADRPLDRQGARAVGHDRVRSSRRTAWSGPAAPTCGAAARPWTGLPAAGVDVEVLPATTAAAFDDDTEKGSRAVLDLVTSTNGAVAWCGQREVIPRLAAALCTLAWWHRRRDGAPKLGKGGLLVLHLDEASAVSAVERLPAAASSTVWQRAGPRSRGGGFGVPMRTDGGDASPHSRGGGSRPAWYSTSTRP